MNRIVLAWLFLFMCSVSLTVADAEDWPTYRHDNRLSGVTSETPHLPLELAWQRMSAVAPTPAWSGPAPWDAFSGNRDLQPQRDFDPAYYTTYANGLLYFGSSVENSVHALDPETGRRQWTFFTEGAVRLPPSIDNGSAFFGSDDGNIYCVDAKNGKLIWKMRGGPSDTRIPCDGKLISQWPCRTGVLIEGGQAYCAFSLVPWKESLLYSVAANDGSVTYRKVTQSNTFQGPMAADEQLVVMQGKAPPIAFDMKSGTTVHSYAAASGVRCAIVGEGRLIVGPAGQKQPDDMVMVLDRKSGKPESKFLGADRMVADSANGYFHREGQLVAFDFEQKKETPLGQDGLQSEPPCELIKAGPILFVGTQGAVTAIDTRSGKPVWNANVKGRACGLTFADGRLFVSTDLGHIYTFASK